MERPSERERARALNSTSSAHSTQLLKPTEPIYEDYEPDNLVLMACMIFTNTGRILVHHELETTCLHYKQLTLLLATLFQFSRGRNGSGFVSLFGYHIFLKSDACTELSMAIVCSVVPNAGEMSTQQQPRVPLPASTLVGLRHHATNVKLKAALVLHDFVERFEPQIEVILEANQAQVEQQAHAYTLTNALGGMHGEQEEITTESAFMDFLHDQIVPLLEFDQDRHLREAISSLEVPQSSTSCSSQIWLCKSMLVQSENLDLAFGLDFRRKCGWDWNQHMLLRRITRAFAQAFPILVKSARLQKSSRQLKSSCLTEAACSVLIVHFTAWDSIYMALRMMPHGLFCGVVVFVAPTPFLDEDAWTPNEDMQRVLISDTCHGIELHSLLKKNDAFQVCLGSKTLPGIVAHVLDVLTNPRPPANTTTA